MVKRNCLIHGASVIGLTCLVGCVSPLKSDDPVTRLKAVEQIESQDDLFFIAMNLGVRVSGRPGRYCEASIFPESYSEDVRTAAVRRITDPVRLLKCASWSSGDIYYDPAVDSGVFTYKGEDYRVFDAERSLKGRVVLGENVRHAAEDRLCDARTFSRVPEVLERFNGGGTKMRGKDGVDIRAGLFPGRPRYFVGGEENAFVDSYASVKRDNPLNMILMRVVKTQKDQAAISAFIIASRECGVDVYPDAVTAAIGVLDGSSQPAIKRVFEHLYFHDRLSKSPMPTAWGWQLLNKIEAPPDRYLIAMAQLGYGCQEKSVVISRDEVNRIAESKFSDAVWVKCYRDELFTGYSRRRMIENIRSQEEMMKFLIDVRKINTEDVGVALARIKDADALERIKKDCYLKIVADKASILHFEMTYPQQLESIGKMSIQVDRALAANEFRKRMEDANIAEGRKRKISEVLNKWIDIGVDQILAESGNLSDVTFSIAGFRVGMKEKEAILLLNRRYHGEDVSWSVDADGLVERINFGTTFLPKIYKFDAQTWTDWIDAFSRKIGKRFVCDELKAEKKPVGGRGVVVSVSQRIWRYQDNRKDLTITYFGDKKVHERVPESSSSLERALKIVRGVTAGDIVKEAVLEGARHWANNVWENDVGGYPGMLRIERGTVGPGGTRLVKQSVGKTDLERTADSVRDTWEAMKDVAPAVENIMNDLMR